MRAKMGVRAAFVVLAALAAAMPARAQVNHGLWDGSQSNGSNYDLVVSNQNGEKVRQLVIGYNDCGTGTTTATLGATFITGNTFSVTNLSSCPRISTSGTFSSATSASGSVTLQWTAIPYVCYCSGSVTRSWSASWSLTPDVEVKLGSAGSSVPESGGVANVGVVLTTRSGAATTASLTVNYATSNGSALAGSDFTQTTGTLTFPSGTASGTTQTISVPITNDPDDEPDETFTVTLAGLASTLVGASLESPSSHTVTILDDDLPAATQIAINAGNNQTATAGSAVVTPPSVIVRDVNNNPVSGVSVVFAVATGGGSLTGEAQTSDASGIAAVGSWTLGTTAGTNSNTLTATSTGLAGSPVTFTASASAGAPAQIAINTGNNQTATAGTAVATPPSVIVRDVNNNPVPGVSVTFAVATGGGSLTDGTQTTNASGMATVGSWTLGPTAGTDNNTLTATSTGLAGSPVTFTATATVGPATQIAIHAGNNQTATVGTSVATPPSVIVRDVNNNPVSGVSVTFAVATGGGSLTDGTQTTNALGIATVGSWTLGTTAGTGNNTLTATSTGLTGSPVTLTASAIAGAATQIAVNAGNNQTAIAGTSVATAPSVIVRDVNNNPVSGVSVAFAVETGGGSLTGETQTTDASGIATVGSWTLGTTAGTNNNTLTATSTGLTGSPVTFTASVTAGAATQIAVNAGDNQTATAGTAVATAPSVIVRDANNNPVSGVSVTFAVATGGGNLTDGTQTTNALGIATVGSWTLGTTAGTGNNTLTATSTGLAGSPVTFTASATAGAATQIAVNAGNNQTATAGTAVATPPSVIVRDVNNNPVSGVSVTFAVATGGGSLTDGTQTTNASGIATVGSWTLGTTAGTGNNTLTATSTGLAGSPVTFAASATAGAATQIAVNAGNNQTATAGTAVATAPSVIVRDVNNNPVSGVSVAFAVATGGGSLTDGTQTTNASGVATVGSWTLGTTAGTNNNTLTATSTGLAGSPVTFAASATAGAATQIAIHAGNNQTATAGSAVATPPSVIVRDVNNNPVSGVSVTFAVATGGGSLTGGTQATNASGIATVGSWTLGTTAGTNNNTLTATSGVLTGSPLTFTASASAGAATQIAINTGNNQTATVGNAVETPPSVIVRDANNNPVPGVSVTFAVATGGGILTGGTQTTNASGVATVGSWTLGTTAGTNNNTLTATSGVLAGSPVTFTASATAGAATQIAVNAGNNQTATAGTAVATPPSVIARDVHNNPVSGVSVTFAVATGGGSLTGETQTTNASGIATVGSWTLGTTAGTDNNTLTATSSGLAGSPVTFTASATVGAATQIAIHAGNNQTATVGSTVATPPSVIVRDVNNNPVSGVSVTFAVATGGGSLTGGTQTTNASGIATVGSWTLGTTSGTNNNTLTATSGVLAGSPVVFTASASAGAATQIAINAGNNQAATAGTSVPTAPSVIVRDVNNNPVSGASVTFAVATGGGSLTDGTQTTNASGIATVGSWTLGTTAGTNNNTLTATSTGLAGSPVTFTASATAGAATQIAVNAGNNQTATAGTAVATAPSVIVRDVNNNPVSGVSVTFAVATGGGSLTGGTQTTNASGIATVGSWTLGTTAGTNNNTLTATSSGLAGSPVTFTASATAGAATQIAVNAGNNQTATAGTSVATAPSVIVRDVNNNPVSGVSVTFAVAMGGGSLTGAMQTTDASGIATVGSWTLGTTAGTDNNALTATSGVLAGSPVTFTASASAGAATLIAINAGNNQTATAGTAVATPPSVIVRDANSNPVPGVSVAFAVATGGGSLTDGTQTTNASGIATVGSWTLGATAGTNNNTLTATSTGLAGSPVTFTASATAGAATQIAISAGDNQAATAGTAVATAPSAIVRDVNNNPVSGVSVTFAVATGGGSVTGGTQTTNASGIATVGSWTLGTTAGTNNNTLTATSTALVGSPVTFTASATAGAATQIAINAGDNQTATAGTAVATAPSVIVRDVNNNPVSGVSVTFAVATGGGGVTGGTQTTNASGIATAGSWILGTTAGTDNNTLTATSAGLTGSPLTFTASATAGAATQIAINAGDNQTATAGTAVATAPSVIVRDVNNNPVSGVSVTFAVASGGGSLTGGTQITDASGVATVGSWTLGTTAGTNNNSMTATSAGLTGSPVTFTAGATAGAATQIAINAGNNQTATAGTAVATAPSVIVRDVNNNPVSGVSVTFAVATGGGSLTGGTQTTSASGIATVGSWTLGTTAGGDNNTLTATSNGLAGSPVTFTASASAGVATQIAINAGNNQTATAGTAVVTAPSVIVRDVNNNPVSGVSVTFAVATGGGSLTDGTQTTNALGIATVGSWTLGTTAGTNNNSITATSPGLTGSPLTFTASASAGAATQIAINAGNNQTATAGTAVATAPSVIVRDVNNNPVSGVSVTFAVATGGGSVTGGTQTTNASGIATVGSWTLGTTAGTNNNTLTATSGVLAGSPVTFTASASAGAATQIAINAGNNQTATAGTAVAAAPSVIVRDVNNNPVSGVSVTFAVATGGGSLTDGTQTTNASGIATVGSWTLGTTAGMNNNSITATSPGLTGSPLTFTASATAGAATQMAVNAGSNQTAIAGTAVATPPSVIVRDVNNNPVSSVSVTFAVASGGGSLTGGTQITDASGVATVGSWTLGTTAGTNNNSMTATSAGLTGSPLTFTASATAGAATQVAINAGNNQTATVGTAVVTPPSVIARDANSNPVSGVSVVFEVATGGGSLTDGLQVTNAAGMATVGSWTLGTTAGTDNNTLTAAAAGLAGSPITFTASAIGSPTVTTPTSALIAATTATLGGDVTSDGGSAITERGVVYSQTAANDDPLIGGAGVIKVTVLGETGLFSAGVTGLSPTTGHSFKAFATNAIGTSYTSVATFITTCPTITLGSLPNGNVNAVYTASAAASGGTGPYTYAVTSESLPGGLSLTTSGEGAGNVFGTPTTTGTFTFDITATDTSGVGTCTGVRSYSVVIDPELGQDFFTLTPCRVFDTRSAAGPLGGPALVAQADRTFVVAGACGIPADAKAISVNLAVTGPTVAGNIRLHPGGTPVPLVSSINFKAGQTRSNNAVIPLSALGELGAYLDQVSGTAHLILDVNGYFK